MKSNIELFRTRLLAVLLISILISPAAFAAKPQKATPDAQFAAIDAVMKQAVDAGTVPGAVVVIGHKGQVVYKKAFGSRSLEPTKEPMTVDTVFDMASLTKPIATATSVMTLIEKGKIRLNDPVSQYIPEFKSLGKGEISVRQLLTHHSGLREDLDLKLPWTGRDTAFRMTMDEKLIYPAGMRFLYSDINYLVLGFLVEKVSGMPLDQYAAKNVFEPLGMKFTSFNPPASWNSRIAPTEYDEKNQMLRGVVHDPTARRMGGVAGHAGLFSTADDVARYAQELLAGEKILKRLTIEKMYTPQTPPWSVNVRGLGWDIDSPFASNRGEFLPVGSFGHTGFTGTSLWIDPATDTFVAVLANGVHPRGGASVVSLRSRVANAAAAALNLQLSKEQKARLAQITGYNETYAASRRIPFRNGQVKQGVDVLVARNFQQLKSTDGKARKIGLVTNHTGVDANGRRTVDLLANAPGVQLVALFSPEHGFAGKLDTTEIGNTKDEKTGVTVHSVYGEGDASRRPKPEVIESLDAIVYDIQDIGVRYYTYETTLGYFMEAAAKAGKEIIVLDRVNPITGSYVQGPVSDKDKSTFVMYHPTPVRHGMTIGELAQLYNTERNINAKLTVVPVEGWLRGDWYDSTGLMWINPSPNMRSLNEATLYPGVGLVEGTNVSVGRGTDVPFEIVGAPWINANELAKYLNERGIPGVRFVPVQFTPNSSKYANELCSGVNMVVTDRNTLDGPLLGIELASALLKLYPNQYQIDKMPHLLGSTPVFNAIKAGQDPRRIAENWQEEIDAFMQVRKKYLIY